jgi:probable F420-dependent oxidoreductase
MTDVWLRDTAVTPELAAQIEGLGYETIWLGGSPAAALAFDPLLAATERLKLGTSIVNIWTAPAKETAESFHRLEAAFPGRFTLGIGAGHKEAIDDYRKPYQALVEYLDELDEAGVPRERRALAALGPRVLGLARDRSAGALPYLTTPEHTRRAREILGPDALLVAEHKVAETVESGRTMLQRYLALSNYVANWHRLGFTEEDTTPPGSDRLLAAMVLRGDVVPGLREHLAAGASSVAIQPLDDVVGTLTALAGRVG